MKRQLRAPRPRALGREYPVDTHFAPRYDPWDVRCAIVPDGDLFRAIRSGHASVVTDHIEAFDEAGIRLRSVGASTPTWSSPRRGSTCAARGVTSRRRRRARRPSAGR
jgi:cation diffusion facilitator CzcD-associated flavoprotein CzcO